MRNRSSNENNKRPHAVLFYVRFREPSGPGFVVQLYFAAVGFVSFIRHAELMCPGIPTDEEQATGLEKIIMTAMKEGSVR